LDNYNVMTALVAGGQDQENIFIINHPEMLSNDTKLQGRILIVLLYP
jgi:hypothetical protein